jgi:hypothetical protein
MVNRTIFGTRTIPIDKRSAAAHFSDVLFIVAYNFNPSPMQVINHHALWSRVFQHQMIFLHWDSLEIHSFSNNNPYMKGHGNRTRLVSAIPLDYFPHGDRPKVPTGNFVYRFMLAAMDLAPEYAGYLIAHDDMAIDLAYLAKLDLGHAWFQDDFLKSDLTPILNGTTKTKRIGWGFTDKYDRKSIDFWWGYALPSWGLPAIKTILLANDDIAQAMLDCGGVGNPHALQEWTRGQSDFWYIPAPMMAVYQRVLTIFSMHNLFLEIAIPSFARCLLPQHNIDLVPLCTAWGKARGDFKSMASNCNESGINHALYHPLKTGGDSAESNLLTMKKIMNLLG